MDQKYNSTPPLLERLPRRPFLRTEAVSLGVVDHDLAELVGSGWLRRPLRGVYYSDDLADTLALRMACLRLVVPEDAVVTDRTAAWLWGVTTALAPGDHLAAPQVSVFRQRGYRLRNELATSGSRDLVARDVALIDGIKVTTPLRTACDLGRLLSRDQALAALDGLVRDAGVSVDELRHEVTRFRGYRGVRQLRALAPLADGRAQSPAESILRLRWLDCSELPKPVPQLRLPGPVSDYYLDLGVWRPRFGVEYDGEAWHGPDREAHDRRRRNWIRHELGFALCVIRREDLFGPRRNVEALLRHTFNEARTAARRTA
jgi:hypothetical protein